MREARDELASDRIRNGDENDGDRRRCSLCGERSNAVDRDKNIDFLCGELSGEADDPLLNFRRKAIIQNNVLTFDISKVAQSPSHRAEVNGLFLRATGV